MTTTQLTLRFPEGLSSHHESCREYVQFCVHTNKSLNKVIAADMDLSPSHLSRKLSGNPNDTMNLTLDDLEKYMNVTGDCRPLDYLNDKYNNKKMEEEIEKLRNENEALLRRLGR